MADSKSPKADRLREQREARVKREEDRARAQALADARQRELQEQERALMTIKQRNPTQQKECKAAEDKIAAKRGEQ